MTITQKVLSAITILISLMACQSELLPDAPDLPDTPFAVTSVEFTADDYQIAQANNAFALRL